MVVMKSLLLVVVLIHIASGFALHAKSKTLANARAGGKVMPGSITGSLRTHKVRVTAAAAAIPAAAPLISPVTAASLRAVAKLLSTVGLGGYASKQGLLNKNALQVLSKLVFGILQPCMLFVNVAQTVSNNAGGGGVTTWLLPLAAASQILMGFVIGKVMGLVIYGKDGNKDDKCQTLTGTTFGNSGPLPFVFVDGLFRNHPDPTILAQANAYISLYLLGWSPMFWMFAPVTLGATDTKGTPAEKRAATIKRVFSPPVVGSLCGLVVGLVPFLRTLFVHKTGLLNPLNEAMRTLGTAYVPAVVLVLAGSLFPAEGEAAKVETSGDGKTILGQDAAFIKQIVSIYASRFFLLPMAGFALVKALKRYVPFLAKTLSDEVLVCVLLLEACMPSAQNSTVIYNLQGKSALAAKMARVLMAIYVLGVPAISMWIAKILSSLPTLMP
jgi:predicted permease